jgi:uncharacterized protein (TIGR03083 family)
VQFSPVPWIEALRQSHDRLRATVEPLGPAGLEKPSYASEWSIAQVLSHLGSEAEIFELILDAGLTGQQAPGGEASQAIWDKWNARTPAEVAVESLRADEALVERFESLDDTQRALVSLSLFGMDANLTTVVRMRLGEHAVHSWDIAVTLDSSATVAADSAELVIDSMGQISAWAGQPDGTELTVKVSTTSPERQFVLRAADGKVTLTDSAAADSVRQAGLPELRLPAEAFIRLVYGRLDPAHTPPVEADGVELDDLRKIFPGF